MNLTIKLFKSYDETKNSIEVHSEQFLKPLKLQPQCEKFISQIFDGIVTKRQFFKSFVAGMFDAKLQSVSRSKIVHYYIILYLIIYRFKDMDLKELSFFLYCQDPLTVFTVLSFIFDSKKLMKFALP